MPPTFEVRRCHKTLRVSDLSDKGATMPMNGGALRLRSQLLGCVFVVAATGLLTAQGVRNVRRWVREAVPVEAGAVVMDYRRCAVVITDDDLQALARPELPLSPTIPLAWLVSDCATAALWNRQVLRLALVGQRRFASCLYESAIAWATEQARLGQSAGQR